MEQYDVFISYRRDGGEYLAHNLYERLKEKGFSVFQDIESLRSGNFNVALYDVIALCKDVVLVLPPGGLDRCNNEDDWVRKELSFALEKEKNIVPVMMPGFEWPNNLPIEIDEIRNLNGLTSSTAYFDEFIEKLSKFLLSSCNRQKKMTQKHSFSKALLFLVYIAGLTYPLSCLIIPMLSFSLIPRIIYFMWILLGAFWLWNCIETRPQFAAMCFGTIKEEELNLAPVQLYSRVIGVFGKKIFISTEKPDGFVSYFNLKRLQFGSWDGKKTNYLKILFRKSLEYYDPSVLYLHSLSRGGQAIKMLVRQGFVIQTTPDFVDSKVDYVSKNTLHVFLYYQKNKLDRLIIYNCSSGELKNHYQGD